MRLKYFKTKLEVEFLKRENAISTYEIHLLSAALERLNSENKELEGQVDSLMDRVLRLERVVERMSGELTAWRVFALAMEVLMIATLAIVFRSVKKGSR